MNNMEKLGVSLSGIADSLKKETHTEVVREDTKFPLEYLPKWLQDTVKDHAESYGTPSELWATAFLTGIAAAAGNKIKLVHGNYTNYPQLWVMIIGKSGDGKSDAGRVAFRRLGEIDNDRYVKFQSDYQEWKESEGQGAAPRWEQLLIYDTTPEALYRAMGYSRTGLTLYRDELSGWFSDFGRYNKSGEIGHYLSIFDNQSFSINRKGDQPLLISKPLLNIYGTIQPGVLSEVLNKNNFEVSGFAQRFMFVYPDFKRKPYRRTTTPSTEYYDRVIDAIVATETDDTLYLSEDAENLYKDFYNEMEDLRYDADDFWAAVYAKAHIQVLRMALTVKTARLVEVNTLFIEDEDMRAAIGMQRYFIDSLERFKKEQPGKEVTKKEIIEAIHGINPEVNQTQLAGMLGVSREHVNRVIRLGHRSQVTPTRKRLQQRNKEVSGCDVNSEASENNINSRSHPDHTLKPLQDNV